MRDGVYDLSHEQYHYSSGVSRSALELFRTSPALYAYRVLGKNPEQRKSRAFEEGTAIHAAILEPERFETDFVIKPSFNRKSASGRAEEVSWDEAARKAGKVGVAEDDRERYLIIADRARKNKVVRELGLLDGGVAEKSIYRTHEVTGLQLKCRPDYWWPEKNWMLDVKSTDSANPRTFVQKSVASYGYHRQEAFYRYVGQAERFIFLAVEKTEPYFTSVIELHADDVLLGWHETEQSLFEMADCLRVNEWTGYDAKIHSPRLPDWVQRQFQPSAKRVKLG